MIEIPLIGGGVALIDDADQTLISGYKWRRHTSGYAMAFQKQGLRTIYMHRLILNAARGQEVDHIDRKPFNNQRANLRLVTHAQNCHNFPPRSATGVLGVYKHANKPRPYQLQIKRDGKRIHCGYYLTLADAAEASNKLRAEYLTHFVPEDYSQIVARETL